MLVAEGQGSYGPVSLYVYKQADGTVRFIFTGIDEHGKSNQLDFEGCQPVYPPASGEAQSQGLCTVDEIDETTLAEDVGAFLQCYSLICDPDFFDGLLAYDCICAQYPTALICAEVTAR